MEPGLLETNLPFPLRRGKVRDVYDLGDQLLIVATDRISAFDCVMPNGIPDKGKILTAMAAFWFARFDKFENHLIAIHTAKFPQNLAQFAKQIVGRSMLVKKTEVIPIECVARGYLTGSGWKEYLESQTVCGIQLPKNLRQCDPLPETIFTPATKAESGHDINIPFDEVVNQLGKETAEMLRQRTLLIYSSAAEYAREKGIIIADTKLEFGKLPDGRIILIDEILTPDSSRFWPADAYEAGHDQPSFDKQYVRNWLEAQTWNKKPPAPKLPVEVVNGTRERYLEAYSRLTGKSLGLL
jgi:phosphoribosylaminoimidazole-succinocarboxamide synthase